ncbi:MAG: tRNA 2-thiouridine(34) synthase MnmA [Candidatus Limnocylindrales bacterium]
MTERVLVAMSGGVDSSVAAALVARSGADAVGVWMRLHDGADSFSDVRRSCCSADAADDARRVASQLDIPFYVLDLEREFEAGVMRPFADAYLSGRTPSPCIDCNSTVKFGALMGRARALYDADVVATGHYARVRTTIDAAAPDGVRHDLLTGSDDDKDQSYFLYGLSADQLAHARFPIGELSKPEVRAIATELGLVTASKPESQELCFVPGGDIGEALERRAGWKPAPGTVLDADGRAAGVHAGAASFTVGQRGGVGVALGERQYVRRVDVRANVIHLGRRADLERASLSLEGLSVTAGDPPAEPFRALVRVRHRAPTVAGWVMPERSGGTAGPGSGAWRVELDRPVWAPAPGQAAVLYAIDEPERVLGGGRITEPAWRA